MLKFVTAAALAAMMIAPALAEGGGSGAWGGSSQSDQSGQSGQYGGQSGGLGGQYGAEGRTGAVRPSDCPPGSIRPECQSASRDFGAPGMDSSDQRGGEEGGMKEREGESSRSPSDTTPDSTGLGGGSPR